MKEHLSLDGDFLLKLNFYTTLLGKRTEERLSAQQTLGVKILIWNKFKASYATVWRETP